MNLPNGIFITPPPASIPRSIWFYIVSGIVLVAIAVSSIVTLYNLDHQLHERDHMIYQVQVHVTQLDALEWRAIARGEVDEEMLTKLAAARRATAASIQRLQSLQAELATSFEQLITDLQRYQSIVDQEFALIEQGDMAAAQAFDEEAVDPAFEQMQETLDLITEQLHQRTQQNHFYIPITFYTLVALFLGGFAWLLWLFLNARHRSELALAQHVFLQQARHTLEEQVTTRTAELDQSNRQLQREINERKQVEEQLRQSQDELEVRVAQRTLQLEQSNRQLEQFAYVASHDLQEPLRMVSGYLQLIDRRYRDQLDTDGREFMQFAVDGASRMQQLIRDLLSYSRIETKGRPFALVDLAATLAQTLTNLQVLIDESQAVITHDPLPALMGDTTQLGQLLQNLLANAIKFRGKAPPRIHLRVEPADDEWRFAVQDNGIGFEPQYAERIFLIFQRLHTRESYPGTGIGLAICKRIVERHGGKIWVESTPGVGSTFYFSLPKQGKAP